MAYRRRRRSKGTWLPTFGTDTSGEAGPQNSVTGHRISLDMAPGVITAVLPLTYDFPQEPVDQSPDHTLADIIGSEYLLQRIVGKCFLKYDRFSNEDESFYVLATAGFFVARADPDENTPIGYSTATPEDINKSYSPLTTDTMREPWIWRRQWWLADTSHQTSAPGVPRSNANYGSIQDGPHIDSKVKRRIRQDDRLYFAISAVMWPPDIDWGANATFGTVTGWLDYRLFGSLRKAKARSAF